MTRVLTTLLLLLVGLRAEASVYTISPDFATVQSTVNNCIDGDIVNVLAGNLILTNVLIITNNVQLIGAGAGQTFMVKSNTTARVFDGSLMLSWCPVTSNSPALMRLSGFTIAGDLNNPDGNHNDIDFYGYENKFRIDHNIFTNQCDHGGMQFQLAMNGVCDHNQIWWTAGDYLYIDNGAEGGTSLYGEENGNIAWASPDQYGSTNQMVFEDNSWNWQTVSPPSWAICDSAYGSWFTFRFNQCTNGFLYTHGTDSSGPVRGLRGIEVYGNTFVVSNQNGSAFLAMRSGTAVVCSNTITGLYPLIGMGVDRSGDFHNPWGGANGLNPWDNNTNSLIASGTYNGTNGAFIMYDSTKTWTAGQWATNGYVLVNTTQPGTNYYYNQTYQLYGQIAANDVHSITVNAAINISQNPTMQWTNGDHYAIYQIAHILDQPGAGQGDLIQSMASSYGTPTNQLGGNWNHATISPIYQWNNILNSTNATLGTDTYSVIQANRDYFDNTPKPGYQPLIYPHPLVGTNQTITSYSMPFSILTK